jgi:putative phage-type endonuclease
MDINYYEQEVERLIDEIVRNDFLREGDIDALIELITSTIFNYEEILNRDQLKIVVSYFINTKYERVYVYPYKMTFTTEQSPLAITGNESTESDDERMAIIKSAEQLMSHKFDYSHPEYMEKKYKRRLARVLEIKSIPQHAQRSEGWFKDRNSCLTATAIAPVINEDKNKSPISVLLDKCDRGAPFSSNTFTAHGVKYEAIANMIYCYRYNVQVGEYGLIRHSNLPVGASPDGICEKKTLGGGQLSKLVGRLLEIKCPYIREIQMTGEIDGEICPHYYWVQVQVQQEVTDLDDCDFLQCKLEEYVDREEFVADTHAHTKSLSKKYNLEKGCIIQLVAKQPKDEFDFKHIYPPHMHMDPNECDKFVLKFINDFYRSEDAKTFVFDRVIYWKLTKINCTLIRRDKAWFESKIPIIEQFWEYIKFYRADVNKLNELTEYLGTLGLKDLSKMGHKRTTEVFQFVHNHYIESFDVKTRKTLRFNKPLYTGTPYVSHAHKPAINMEPKDGTIKSSSSMFDD